jgi:transposase
MKSTMTGQQTDPAAVLEGFVVTLLTDGAGAYNLISSSDDVIRAGCWAHARRKFFEARTEAPANAGVARAEDRVAKEIVG